MVTITKYLKWLLISFLYLFQISTLTSCALSNMTQPNHHDTSGSFHYKYGNSQGTHGEFWIWTENGITYFEGLTEATDIYVDAFAEVDIGVFNDIAQIILDNRIDLWDGFSKNNPNVLDGHGFSLDVEYGTNSIHADGYMFEPENYQVGHEALLDYLCEYAKSMPVTTPPVDSVGYIIVSTKEYRFDLMLGLYDGVYSRVDSINITKKQTDRVGEGISYKFYRSRYGDEIPASQYEKYVECNFEPAQQIRKKSLEFISTNGLPGFGQDYSEYVAIHYEGHKIKGRHFSHVALTDDEQDWFTLKMMSVAGLPEDFDLSSLFDIEG